MSTNATNYLTAVVAALKTGLDLKACDIHPGAFSLNEVKKVASKSPCAFVALLSLPDATDKTCLHTACHLSPVVFLFADGKKGGSEIIDLAVQAKALIKGNRFNTDYATAATDVEAKNLYTEALGNMKISAWVLNFNTSITI